MKIARKRRKESLRPWSFALRKKDEGGCQERTHLPAFLRISRFVWYLGDPPAHQTGISRKKPPNPHSQHFSMAL